MNIDSILEKNQPIINKIHLIAYVVASCMLIFSACTVSSSEEIEPELYIDILTNKTYVVSDKGNCETFIIKFVGTSAPNKYIEFLSGKANSTCFLMTESGYEMEEDWDVRKLHSRLIPKNYTYEQGFVEWDKYMKYNDEPPRFEEEIEDLLMDISNGSTTTEDLDEIVNNRVEIVADSSLTTRLDLIDSLQVKLEETIRELKDMQANIKEMWNAR